MTNPSRCARTAFCAVVLAAALLCCVFPSRLLAAQGWPLTVLHTNDVHSRLVQFTQYGSLCLHADDAGCVGGAARLGAAIARQRARKPHTLLLDAGDQFTGTALFAQYKGQAAAALMNTMQYDAMTLGNHEFDQGPAQLARFIDLLDFPLLACNASAWQEPVLMGRLRPFLLKDIDGRLVGIIGAATPDTATISSAGAVRFSPPAAAVQATADHLARAGANVIIVLSHLGYGEDLALAAQLRGVDIIVGGHSHTLLSNAAPQAQGPYPAVAKALDGAPVLVVSTGKWGRYLGSLDVEFDATGRAVAWTGDTIPMDADLPRDADLLAIATRFVNGLGDDIVVPIGSTTAVFDPDPEICRTGECALGDLATDAVLEAARPFGATAVFYNAGGLRAALPAGQITTADVLSVFPFGNSIGVFTITGDILRRTLEHGASRLGEPTHNGTGRFLQVAGMRYTITPSAPVGSRVSNVMVNGAPLDPAKTYTLASNAYILGGGDDYQILKENAQLLHTIPGTTADALAEHINRISPATPTLHGRIQRH